MDVPVQQSSAQKCMAKFLDKSELVYKDMSTQPDCRICLICIQQIPMKTELNVLTSRKGTWMYKRIMQITRSGVPNQAWKDFLTSERNRCNPSLDSQLDRKRKTFLSKGKNQCSHLKCVRTKNCFYK